MINLNTSQKIFLTFIGLFIIGCVEPITINITNFEDSLIVEATITNEFKYQQVKLTRSFKFGGESPSFESNATVKIIDDSNTEYLFQEESSGNYVSINKFNPQLNTNYHLSITTSNGKNYKSTPTQLPNNIPINNIEASREIDNLGKESVSIIVNSFDPTGSSRYYRYEYEETYKIIAPYWSSQDLVVSPRYTLSLVPKTKEEQVCYNTVLSNTIIQTETNDLSEDRVKFSVREISKNNPILTTRYSILVKQYIQTLEAYTYYRTLKKLSGNDNVFSQNQPGFINGNVFSVDSQNENVIGFFELSSVSSKRIYFNYPDVFPSEPLPPYFVPCDRFATGIGSPPPPSGESNPLTDVIESGGAKFYSRNLDPAQGEGPYNLVLRACGDCTVLGSNIKPDFWEE